MKICKSNMAKRPTGPPPSYLEATCPPSYDEAISMRIPRDLISSRSPSPVNDGSISNRSRPTTPQTTTRIRQNTGLGLTFLDFVPEKISSGRLFGNPQFENFPVLLKSANAWLQNHPDVEVSMCESVEFKCKTSHVETEKATYFEHGEGRNYFIRALRLWLSPRGERLIPQQIRYFNMVPECLDPGGFLTNPRFQTLQGSIDTMNKLMQRKPIEGRILNVETQEMKVHRTGQIDPDCSCWSENSEHKRFFIFIFRVFYEVGNPTNEGIGIIDFTPQCLQRSAVFCGPLTPVYETFSTVLAKASSWCQQQFYRFINVQSIEIKLKGGQLDTQRMSYTEHAEGTTHYVRIIRVAYAIPFISDTAPPLERTIISCKTFVPIQLTPRGLFGVPDFETISQTRTRLMHWMKITGAKVISAETVDVKMYSGGQSRLGPEATYTYNHGDKDEYWIHVIRVFLDGIYLDPPAEVLPPIPHLTKQDDCVIA